MAPVATNLACTRGVRDERQSALPRRLLCLVWALTQGAVICNRARVYRARLKGADRIPEDRDRHRVPQQGWLGTFEYSLVYEKDVVLLLFVPATLWVVLYCGQRPDRLAASLSKNLRLPCVLVIVLCTVCHWVGYGVDVMIQELRAAA